MTSRDGPAQLSRGWKPVKAGGSPRQWESADTEEFRSEALRGELKIASVNTVLSEKEYQNSLLRSCPLRLLFKPVFLSSVPFPDQLFSALLHSVGD